MVGRLRSSKLPRQKSRNEAERASKCGNGDWQVEVLTTKYDSESTSGRNDGQLMHSQINECDKEKQGRVEEEGKPRNVV